MARTTAMLARRMGLAVFSNGPADRIRAILRPRQVFWMLTWLPVLWLVARQVELMGDFRVDDAYITFSFSKNLAGGHGPLFSHGLRVEGYSNFLWMILTAIGYWVAPQADPYITARGLSFAALAFIVIAVYRLVRRTTGQAWPAWLAVVLTLFCSDLFRAAYSGIETAAFTAAVLGGWYAYLVEPTEARRWSLFAFLPAALLRIDGFVPLLIAAGFEALSAFNERRFAWKTFLRWALPACIVWALYFAWRYAYYGLPLPTTYYAKTVVTALEPQRGVNQLWEFLRDYGLFAFLPIGLTPVFWGPRREALTLWTAIALQLGYAAHVGGDWMPFQRFFLPIVPLGAVLAGLGLHRLTALLGVLRPLLAWPLRGAAVGLLGFVAVHMYAGSVDSTVEREKLGLAQHTEFHTKGNLIRNADLMRLVLRRPGERLVTDYAGVFSVMTDAHIIDQWGLCNADIALNGSIEGINPIYGKECSKCYARLDPEYLHVGVPIVRDANAFSDQRQVIDNVFQGWAIDRVIDLQNRFVVGRVRDTQSGRTLWFLEKKRAGLSYADRDAAPGIVVEYPFG